MADIDTALNASHDAIQQLLRAGERTRTAWASPRAPGKWSPSQIVEHVARSLEESANVAAGRPSKFPKLPAVVHPIVRGLLFKRVLRKAVFPKAKTNKAMNPASGPATPDEGRVRLETAHQKFDEACRQKPPRTASRCEQPSSARCPWRTTCASWNSTRVITASRWRTVSRRIRWPTTSSSLIAFDRRSAPGTTSPTQDVRWSRLSLPQSDVLRYRRERSDGANS
jgi:hypothetical protein